MAKLLIYPLCLLALAACMCASLNGDGSGTNTGNGVITGMVVAPGNEPGPAVGAKVRLRRGDFLSTPTSGLQKIVRSSADRLTDRNGRFFIDSLDTGAYCIEVNDGRSNAVLFRTAIARADTLVDLLTDTLKPTGTIKGTIPTIPGIADVFVEIFGLDRLAGRDPATGVFVITDVPEGIYTIRIVSESADPLKKEINGVAVTSGAETDIGKLDPFRLKGWGFSKTIHFNTTPSGANVAGNVLNFPVLVRLTSNNFDFSGAGAGGHDLRFAKSDKTPMPCEIERWDANLHQAEIWVKIDTVYGNDSTQHIEMYWGNPDATDESNGAAVFDTAAGFAGVWHLGESGGMVTSDATVNGITGFATATTPVAGIVGTAQMFNGTSSFIEASGPASDRLNFQDKDPYSLCAWVNANAIDTFHAIVFKSNFQYGLGIRPEKNWEFFNYASGTGWQWAHAPASAGTWHFVAGVWNGYQQYLYVDGMAVDSARGVTAWSSSRVFSTPFQIGNCPDGAADVDRHFNGVIDEVRVEKTARNADWIKLCYMNQNAQDALVKW